MLLKPSDLEVALVSHTFDHLTGFCCACGQSLEHIYGTAIPCFGGEETKIVAISHLRRGGILLQEGRLK